tara:strand:+ start:280 stop:765 length:486 start_codon:yes stop_codon:yes gene_type:complete
MLNRLSVTLGKVTSWLMLLMVIATFAVVVMRYVFDIGLIWLQESVIWMHAVAFMVGASYTLHHEEHVRVDIFYRQLNPTHQAWINLIGVIIFLFPLCFFIGWEAFDFVAISWRIQEASRESGGLPYPMIPLLKSILMVMPITVSLQGIAMILDCIRTIRKD